MNRRGVGALFAAAVAVAASVTLGLSQPSGAQDASSTVTVPAPAGGSVTVDQTAGLVNQTVHVSWTGFKPSSQPVVTPGATMYVVRVYQCRTDAPTGPGDCYGSSVYTYDGQSDPTQVLPDGPSNHRNAATASDGTGALDFEVRTAIESSTLGCISTTACSIVVVPNYGNGKKGLDFINATTDHMDAAWAWANHVTIPIHMAPGGAICPLGTPGVSTVGAPMLQRAIVSWQPAACQAQNAVNIDYTGLGETQGRSQYLAGSADVGLTTLPAAADDGARPTAYAPLALSGITVAYHIDDGVTGSAITDMKLNARLVAKLITESYGGVGYVAPGAELGNGNPATQGNPFSIYSDPEFLALNPGHTWPQANATNPLLLAGNSDMTWELTRWITNDPDARAFLDGADDGHGMHVNTNFLHIQYPATSLETRDPYPALSYTFVPVNGLEHVARGLVADQPSSSNPNVDELGQHPKDPQQLPGHRALMAIIDTADAAAFAMPTAQLLNAGGAYVAPTTASLSAALTHMKVDDRTHTRTADVRSDDAAAYPLAMLQYAMVPTGDVGPDKADEIVKFLDYVGNAGQVSGATTGNLPNGYVPLSPDLKTELDAAETAVRTQSGKPTAVPTTPTSTTSVAPGGSDQFPDPGYDNGMVGGGTAANDPVAASGGAAPLANDPSKKASSGSVGFTAAHYDGTAGTGGTAALVLIIVVSVTAAAGLGGPVLVAHSGGVFARFRRPRRG